MASCDACSPGQYQDQKGKEDCKEHSARKCPAGEGYIQGSAFSDSQCSACAEGKFSAQNDTQPCVDVNNTKTCSAGEGYVAATLEADSMCEQCGKGKFQSASNHKEDCKEHSARKCPA